MPLTDAQRTMLDAPLDPSLVAQRAAGGDRKVSYLEGHEVINAANRIFGYGLWGHTVDRIDCKQIGQHWLYTAIVTVTVDDCQLHQDVGVGAALKDTTDEHDKAIKTAVTDGLKRALRVYGDQFANSLYDRDNPIHDEVKALHGGAQRPARPAPPARTVTTPAGAVTTAPLDEAREMYPQIEAARRLYDQVVAALAQDAEAAQMLANDDKGPEKQTPEQLERTLAWLTKRAQSRAAAPDYGKSYEDLRTALLDAHTSGNADEIRAARLAIEQARTDKTLSDSGFTVLKKLNSDKEAERALAGGARR